MLKTVSSLSVATRSTVTLPSQWISAPGCQSRGADASVTGTSIKVKSSGGDASSWTDIAADTSDNASIVKAALIIKVVLLAYFHYVLHSLSLRD